MILIDPDATYPRAALPKRELSRFLLDACLQVGLAGEVTVLLSTDERLRELNRTYRRKNKATDVLSFPPAPLEFAGAEQTGGDLAISLDMAKRQADALGHALVLEVKVLMLHGLLHLAGMDHEQDAGQMARREGRLRRLFELPAGLIQRTVGVEGKNKPAFGGPTSQKRDVGHPSGSSPTRSGSLGSSPNRAGALAFGGIGSGPKKLRRSRALKEAAR